MSEPIKVGDLVVVVKWPCCGVALGHVFQVSGFKDYGKRRCAGCKTAFGPFAAAESDPDPADGMPYSVPLPWLKRIPPLSELDDVKREEEIAA